MARIAGVAALTTALYSAEPLYAEPSGRDAFVQWAASAAVSITHPAPDDRWHDLEPLGDMVGDASVVALSEAVHAGAEPLEFRNRVFQHLVRQKQFTAIAIESGIVEGRLLHDYVQDGRGDLSVVLKEGLSWTFDRLPQNEALVRWIAGYNADPRVTRKLNLYGFDVPGSPGNPFANRGTRSALAEALAYLGRVDSQAAAAFRLRLETLLPSVDFDPRRTEGASYHLLGPSGRDTITSTVADIVALLERKEALYVAASSPRDYQWAYRAAIGARQVDGWLRHLPIGWQPPITDKQPWIHAASDVRDRAQADNLDWIIDQEGAAGKILVFASRYHLSMHPVTRQDASAAFATIARQEVAGTYLRRRLGNRLITIGNLIRQGSIACAGFSMSLSRAPRETLDGLAGEVGLPRFLLDLRLAPAPVATWLNEPQRMREDVPFSLAPGKAFDVLLYIDTVTPACGS